MKRKQKLKAKIGFTKQRGKRFYRLLLIGNNYSVVFTGQWGLKAKVKNDIALIVGGEYNAEIMDIESGLQVLVTTQAKKSRILLATQKYRSTSRRFDAQKALNSLLEIDWKQIEFINKPLLEID